MIQGHILKFLGKNQPRAKQGKLCTPSETYGHSIQSPDWFKRKFSLPAKGGYQYKFDDPKFKYFSQKNQSNIIKFETNVFDQNKQKGTLINNRKKGLLSEYLDKNAWMNTVLPLTGFERNQEARRLNNIERDKNIETIRLKKTAYIASKTMSNFYSTKRSGKFLQKNRQIYTSQKRRNCSQKQPQNNPEFLKIGNITHQKNSQSSNNVLFGQKQRIKSTRNELALNKIHSIEKIKIQQKSNSTRLKNIDKDFVKNIMTLTAREWGKGKCSSPSKTIERFEQIIYDNNSGELPQKSNRIFFNQYIKDHNNGFMIASRKYSKQL